MKEGEEEVELDSEIDSEMGSVIDSEEEEEEEEKEETKKEEKKEQKIEQQLNILGEYKKIITKSIEEEEKKKRTPTEEKKTKLKRIKYKRGKIIEVPNEEEKESKYDFYEPIEEYSRQGIEKYVFIEQEKYGICPTYPKVLVEPLIAGNYNRTIKNVLVSAENRSKKRIPALSYYHKKTNASIYRCAQPIGIGTPKDEDLLNMFATNGKNLLILDCRTTGGAIWNTVKGGWESATDTIDVEMLEIENIAAAKYAYEGKADENTFSAMAVSTLMSTMYKYNHSKPAKMRQNLLKSILIGAERGVRAINEGQSVLIHCSDGWDRTAQIVSLMQIMLDPYYRTVKGFFSLFEKEWFAFGHKFADRLGYSKINKESSPIFIQFLECVIVLLHDQFDYNNELYFPIIKLATEVAGDTEFFSKSMFKQLKLLSKQHVIKATTKNCEKERTNEENSSIRKYVVTSALKKGFQHERFPYTVYHLNNPIIDTRREEIILADEFLKHDQLIDQSDCLPDESWLQILKKSCGLRNSSGYIKQVCSGMKATMRRKIWNTKFSGFLKSLNFINAYALLKIVRQQLASSPLHDVHHELVMLKFCRVQEKVTQFLNVKYKGDHFDAVARSLIRLLQLIMIERSWHHQPKSVSIEERMKSFNEAIDDEFMHHPLDVMIHCAYNIFFTLQHSENTYVALCVLFFDKVYNLYDDHLSSTTPVINSVVYRVNKKARKCHEGWGNKERKLHQYVWQNLLCESLNYEDWTRFMDYLIFSGNSGRKELLFVSLAIQNGLCEDSSPKLSFDGVFGKAIELFEQ